MKIQSIKFIWIILLLGMIVACKKQVAGPKGETGMAGQNGNANQNNIDSFLLLSQDWVTNSVKKDWNANVFNSLITENIVQSGNVDIYVNVNSEWFRLPYTKDDFHLQYKLSNGLIILNYFKSHGVADPPDPMRFRMVIVSSK